MATTTLGIGRGQCHYSFIVWFWVTWKCRWRRRCDNARTSMGTCWLQHLGQTSIPMKPLLYHLLYQMWWSCQLLFRYKKASLRLTAVQPLVQQTFFMTNLPQHTHTSIHNTFGDAARQQSIIVNSQQDISDRQLKQLKTFLLGLSAYHHCLLMCSDLLTAMTESRPVRAISPSA